MTIAEELRERLKLRYMGDCKCGHCALVPDELVARAAAELDRLSKLAEQEQAIQEKAIYGGHAALWRSKIGPTSRR